MNAQSETSTTDEQSGLPDMIIRVMMDEQSGLPNMIIRVRRPLQPELPPVEAAYVDGKWQCEDEYIRTWLEDEADWIRSTQGYVPYPEWEAAAVVVKTLDGEILFNDFHDDGGDEFTIY